LKQEETKETVEKSLKGEKRRIRKQKQKQE
jgi:hypothetical protein